MRTAVARGRRELPEGVSVDDLPEPRPDFMLDGEIELVRWIELGGVKTAVLTAHASAADQGSFDLDEVEELAEPHEMPFADMSFAGTLRHDAQFVVLESGQLVHASMVEVRTIDMGFGAEDSMKQRHTLTAEARLVEACAGPVLPTFDDRWTPSERSLQLVAELRDAAASDPPEPAKIRARLSPELASAAPEAADCLVDAARSFGPLALGVPEFAAYTTIDEAGEGVTVTIRTELEDGDGYAGELILATRSEGDAILVESFDLRRYVHPPPQLSLLRFDASGLKTSLACTGPSDGAAEEAAEGTES